MRSSVRNRVARSIGLLLGLGFILGSPKINATPNSTPEGGSAAGSAQLEIVGTTFQLTLPNGQKLSQSQLIGTIFTVQDEQGSWRRIRIDGIEADPRDPSGEITLYHVMVEDPATHVFSEFCRPGPDGLVRAFPLAGQWTADGRHLPSAHGFNVTCTSGAIGKCVRFGYKPWKKGPNGESLWDYHQACVRLLRADYCGDGHAFTRDGTEVDVFDSLGIQSDTTAPGMVFEAGWGPAGALCVQHPRIKENITLKALEARCPQRLSGRTGEACTEAALRGQAELRVLNRSKP